MTYTRPWELRRRILECQMNGMTANEAAAWLGLSPCWLNSRRRQFGLPRFERPQIETPLVSTRAKRQGDYTPDDEALLRCCIDAGCTAGQAATLLGRSLVSVRCKQSRLGLPRFWPNRSGATRGRAQRGPRMARRLWKDERLARLRLLRDAGHSMPEIAARFGTTKNAIIGAIHRYILPQGAQP